MEDILVDKTEKISFVLNGKKYTVDGDIPPWTRLVDFLREKAKLCGTKVVCREAGCGICTVVITRPDLEYEGRYKTYSVPSCQTLLYACDGWSIETVENLGDRFTGYHSLQKALHGFTGTQCGYCSPGMIMHMYGQIQNGPLTMSQVERSLDGNLCRCTGYRPILDAFKSFAVDADQVLKNKLTDIEEVYKGKCQNHGGKGCENCKQSSICKNKDEILPWRLTETLRVSGSGVEWHRPISIEGIYEILRSMKGNEKVRIIVGNTGQGVFKNEGPFNVYISTVAVADLYRVSDAKPLVLGANVSLTRTIEVFQEMASIPGYSHLGEIAKHWRFVANTSVRNTGCWAGNLMMKYNHRAFPSDVFLTLLAAEAQLEVGDAATGEKINLNLEEFLNFDMTKRVILSITLPPLPGDTKLRTFKITPRAVNAHAYVNACIRMQLDHEDGNRVTQKPLIVFGGINPEFIRASETENYLHKKQLNELDVLREAITHLSNELNPDSSFQDASPEYRKSLSLALLYMAIGGFIGGNASPEYQTAGTTLERCLSRGEQSFDMNNDIWPLGQPVTKLESATQVSGEAKYMDDVQPLHNELHAAFVQTTVANAKIKMVNTEKALKLSGVVTWVSRKDIPGKNSFAEAYIPGFGGPDPIFVDERVIFAGQPIGVIVAKDRDTAVRAAKLVTVEYEDIKMPVLTIHQAIQEGQYKPQFKDLTLGDYEKAIEESEHQLSGELLLGGQYHFTLEPHGARVIPTEDGYDVFCTSQWTAQTQTAIAEALDVPVNSINVTVRRLGGGYGFKLTRQNLTATAAAIAAAKTKQPVRLVLDLTTNLTCVGGREPYYSKYEVGFDKSGKLTALKFDFFSDAGHVENDASCSFVTAGVQNTYYVPNYTFTSYVAKTDTAANTFCRSPGFVEAIASVENIMDHIAHYLQKDPLKVRELNLVPANVPRLNVPPHDKNVVQEDILPLLKEKASILQRKGEVEEFNKKNRWKKRGLSVVPMWHGIIYYPPFKYGMFVVIYERDGTVAISHGGIEMGQGLNTKVAQVAAYTLGIPLEKVVVKASDTMMGANSAMSGASLVTDLCCQGVKKSCEKLKQRLDVIKAKMGEDGSKEPSWEELTQRAYSENVDLSERCWVAGEEVPEDYDVWGATCLEVELDILTGEYMIKRVDLIEDCGRSLNPYVDIGQVEGAFVMGLGLFTSEVIKFNPNTGQKLSDGTWEYKPPTASDIPRDFRITLLPNAKHPRGVLGSKAIGEPPLIMSYAVVSALRQAISSFRASNGDTEWFVMDTPITVEKAHQLCEVKPEYFQF